MRKHIVLGIVIAIAIAILGTPARAQEATVRVVPPGSVGLNSSPTGAQAGYVHGSPQQSGLYVLLARYPAGTRGAPHSHPDQRVLTVLSGTLYAGTGATFDDTKAQALPPGSILVIPANVLHWSWAKDGDVLSEEVGVGPTSNQFPGK